MNRITRETPWVLGLLDVLRLTEPRSADASQFTVAGARTFFTKRTQFFQKTIQLQLASNVNVAEIVHRKSVGFLYTKRTQFGRAKSGNIQSENRSWGARPPRALLDTPSYPALWVRKTWKIWNFSERTMFSAGARKTAPGAGALPI